MTILTSSSAESNAVPATGKRGTELRKLFMTSPYGWPQEAVDGSLLALLGAGAVRATRNGDAVGPKQLGHGTIGQTDFYGEAVTLTGLQKIELRKLLQDLLGITVSADELGAAVPKALVRLSEMAAQAGTEAPFPAPPHTPLLDTLKGKAGNEQLAAVHAAREDLRNLVSVWKTAAATIAARRPEWERLTRLLTHARDLPEAAAVEPQVEALRTGRTGLAEPDPHPPLIDTLATALRTALASVQTDLAAAHTAAMASLDATEEWNALSGSDRGRFVQENGLEMPPSPAVGTVDALVAALDARSLAARRDQVATLPGRAARAREQAAKLLVPTAAPVHPKSATLKTTAEVDAYLADLRAEILGYISAGRPVII